jgi:hypothetical protein
MTWATAGLLTDPNTNTILADTGAIAAGSYQLTLLLFTTVACGVTFHYRDAANTSDIKTQQITISTETNGFQVIPINTPISIGANERFTLTLDQGFTGGVIQCGLVLGQNAITVNSVDTTNWATVTGVAGAAVTLTMTAPGAGNFHHITELQIVKFAAATLTVAATPVLVTTTNLTGNPIFSFDAPAAAQGTISIQQFQPSAPFKSAVANTATTIVCPATANVIWRINAAAYLGP